MQAWSITSRKISHFTSFNLRKATSWRIIPMTKQGNCGPLDTEMVNTSLHLLRRVRHAQQDDKSFIDVSTNDVGVRNYRSYCAKCSCRPGEDKWARIQSEDEKVCHLPTSSSDSLLRDRNPYKSTCWFMRRKLMTGDEYNMTHYSKGQFCSCIILLSLKHTDCFALQLKHIIHNEAKFLPVPKRKTKKKICKEWTWN